MQLQTVRQVSYIEGLSLLLLFLVAMPLKYYFGIPVAVRVVGSLHGFLFLVLTAVLVRSCLKRALGWGPALSIFVLAILPFGFLEVERMMKKLDHPA